MSDAPVEKIVPISRGADLTDADLRLIVEDFIVVRNWAALKMRMGVAPMKENLFQALRARLGRREPRVDKNLLAYVSAADDLYAAFCEYATTPGQIEALRDFAKASNAWDDHPLKGVAVTCCKQRS